MSVWSRQKPAAEKRDTWPSLPWSSYWDLVAAKGGQVTVSSPESALQSVAVRAATDLLASLASELPVDVFSGEGRERRKRPTPGYLLDPAGDGQGLEDWSYQVMMSWLLRGNLYGEVLATGPGGYPTQVLPQYPDEVTARLSDNGDVLWSFQGKPVPASRVLHRRVNPVPGRVLGLSPIAMHANKISLDLTANQFGLQFFADGAHPVGMLVNEEQDMSNNTVVETAKRRFMAALRGKRDVAVLGRGWKYQQLSIAPEESQFLETQQFSSAECARMFGAGVAETLGYESGGSMTYANVESRSIHLLVYTANRWMRRLDRLLTFMLPRPQYVRLNRDAMLQSTTLDRLRVHEIALRNAIKVVNEVRENEDLQPVPWGDVPISLPAPAAPTGGGDGDEDPKGGTQ